MWIFLMLCRVVADGPYDCRGPTQMPNPQVCEVVAKHYRELHGFAKCIVIRKVEPHPESSFSGKRG